MKIKHTVIIIAYNVEKYIAEALDSCLNQSIKPYEIIIGENCSTDNTKSMLLEYQEKYPNIIKIIFHEKNLGEYGNRNYLKEHIKVNGNMVHLLDGDDVFEDGMFEEFNNVIIQNKLNPEKEKFIIMSNVANLYLDGSKKMMLNNYKYRYYENIMRLKIRNLLGSRNTGISKTVYEEAPLWNNSLGMWTDYRESVGLYENVDKLFFIDKTFPLYRIGSGITSNDNNQEINESYESTNGDVSKTIQLHSSYLKVINSLYNDDIKNKDIFDMIYLKKEIYRTKYILDKNIKNSIYYCLYKLLDLPIALKYDGIKKYLFEYNILLPNKLRRYLKRIKGLMK